MTTTPLRPKEDLRRRYRALLRSGERFTADTMAARIRTPEGLTQAEVLALAETVMEDMYKAQLQRHHLKLGTSSENLMTNDPRTDPKPPNEPWLERPLTAEELKDLKARLSKMAQTELVKFYEAALFVCRLDNGEPPRAAFIQQFVAAWKEMQRRRKAKVAH